MPERGKKREKKERQNAGWWSGKHKGKERQQQDLHNPTRLSQELFPCGKNSSAVGLER